MSNPRQRAHRILRPMALFDGSEAIESRAPVVVRERGSVIGVYNVDSRESGDCIWISEDGIWIRREDVWEHLPYDKIKALKYPDASAEVDKRLSLYLSSGDERSLHIAGSKGRTRDVYEFGRFLQRSKADLGGTTTA